MEKCTKCKYGRGCPKLYDLLIPLSSGGFCNLSTAHDYKSHRTKTEMARLFARKSRCGYLPPSIYRLHHLDPHPKSSNDAIEYTYAGCYYTILDF